MKTAHRYTLEPYKGMNSRYCCPYCGENKKFSRYIDTETGKHVHPTVGKCERLDSCGIHYTPKQFFQDNNISLDTLQVNPNVPKEDISMQKAASYIQAEIFHASLNITEPNSFVMFLIDLFGIKLTNQLINKYFIGTSKKKTGATIFWQVDKHNHIRTGKIMVYNPKTGKRVKEPYSQITWAHTALNQPEFELKQCLFGEHLLQDKSTPVAIVESEKTAIIASIYLPEFTWLACGGKDGLNTEKCKVLAGYSVFLFPDLNGFENWRGKAKELSSIAHFTVSDLLECKANEIEKEQGLDIADYLIRFEWREFRSQKKQEQRVLEPVPSVKNENREVVKTIFTSQFKESPLSEKWQSVRKAPKASWPIADLEQFFTTTILPTAPIKLDTCSTIIDLSKFVSSHLSIVKAQNGNPCYLPYLDRLCLLKNILTINSN